MSASGCHSASIGQWTTMLRCVGPKRTCLCTAGVLPECEAGPAVQRGSGWKHWKLRRGLLRRGQGRRGQRHTWQLKRSASNQRGDMLLNHATSGGQGCIGAVLGGPCNYAHRFHLTSYSLCKGPFGLPMLQSLWTLCGSLR